MRLEDMRKEIPETPKFIHEMIQSEVGKQLQEEKAVSIPPKRNKKRTGAAAAAAAIAAGILATSTIAYAGVKLYHMYLEKEGTYSVTTGIRAEGVGETALPDRIHEIEIVAKYIPEGMKWVEESHLEYPEHQRNGGFSFQAALLDDDYSEQVMQDKGVVECEERTFGNYEGVYLKYHDLAEDGSFNQRIYLLCPDVYRVIIIHIGDDVSKEEAMKVTDNLLIAETDTMIETADCTAWSELVSPEQSSGEAAVTSAADDELPIYRIGEEFVLSDELSVCVQSVQIEDDLQLLGQTAVPEEWAGAVGDDGKLVNNTLSYIKSGDGIHSVDKIVKTESVKQKLVYVTVTYTNKSEKEMNHILYGGTLMLMDHGEETYQIYNPAFPSGDGYDRVVWDGAAAAAEMTYSSVVEDYGNGGNYIPSLKSGESIRINMAWIVNEHDLDKMYLNLNTDGGAYEFTDSTLKTGVADIRR